MRAGRTNAERSASLTACSDVAQIRRQPGGAGQALRKAIGALNDAQGKVGWFENARYEDGTPVALVAVVQEHGSTKRGIPARPFMRTTQQEKAQVWKEDARRLAAAVAAGQMPPDALMEGLTQKAEGDVRQSISRVLSPPLSERTIAARARRHSKGKASSKPLVDTGYMLNTLTSQVKKK